MNVKESLNDNNWNLMPSKRATRTSNPIRKIVDQLRPDPKNSLPIISLALGDPCVFGNLPPPALLIRSIEDNVKDNKSYGYGPAAGLTTSRETLAREYR
jgi:tyrosine aminotransferase